MDPYWEINKKLIDKVRAQERATWDKITAMSLSNIKDALATGIYVDRSEI